MIKKIIGAALTAVILISAPTYAQSKDSASTAKRGKFTCVMPPRKDIHKSECNLTQSLCYPNEFEGMKLSDKQKEQLKTLKTCRSKSDCKSPQKGIRGDKRCDRDKMRHDCKEARKKYLEEVKKIVGNKNYTIYLENYYINSGNKPGDKVRMKKGHDRIGRHPQEGKISSRK